MSSITLPIEELAALAQALETVSVTTQNAMAALAAQAVAPEAPAKKAAPKATPATTKATCGYPTAEGTKCRNVGSPCVKHVGKTPVEWVAHHAGVKAKHEVYVATREVETAQARAVSHHIIGFTAGHALAKRSARLAKRLGVTLPQVVSEESVTKAFADAGYTVTVVPAKQLSEWAVS